MTDAPASSTSRKRTPALFAALLLFVLPLAAFILLEGGSSLLLFVHDLTVLQPKPLAREVSTRYDAELGWAAIPNMSLPDFYGKDIGLHTNARGFRGVEQIDSIRPAGRKRLICSGDSFTLGVGVRDSSAWCARLASSTWQVVNMGQGAYGPDQAYLWYVRDGAKLEHDVQLLAVITADFPRMASDNFLSFPKPLLRVRNDSLVVTNVPVPQRTGESWIVTRLEVIRSLRMAHLAAGLLRSPGGAAARGARSGEWPDIRRRGDRSSRLFSTAFDEETRAVMAQLLNDLATRHRNKGTTLALVYLPVEFDYTDKSSDKWRSALSDMASSTGVVFVDLIPEMRRLSRDEVARLFIHEVEVEGMLGKGHFNDEGNRWAAEAIRAALPHLALGGAARPGSSTR